MYNLETMFTPNKKLGQNFLKDKNTILKMIDALEVSPKEEVVEIGPGLGAITLELVNKFGHSDNKITAIELDTRFVDKLKDMFSEILNFSVEETNVLKWLPTYKPKSEFHIIGSLPYYITSPIIHGIVKMNKQPKTTILVTQKEVAQKICAVAPASSYFSVFVQTFFEVKYLGQISKKHFSPIPKVDGGIIKLVRREGQQITNIKSYEGFLHLGFSNPRKMLNKMFKQDELNRAEIDGSKRAQNYDWENWVKFFTILR